MENPVVDATILNQRKDIGKELVTQGVDPIDLIGPVFVGRHMLSEAIVRFLKRMIPSVEGISVMVLFANEGLDTLCVFISEFSITVLLQVFDVPVVLGFDRGVGIGKIHTQSRVFLSRLLQRKTRAIPVGVPSGDEYLLEIESARAECNRKLGVVLLYLSNTVLYIVLCLRSNKLADDIERILNEVFTLGSVTHLR